METAAKVFNWISFIGGVIAGIVILALGYEYEVCRSSYGSYYCFTQKAGYPFWVWLIFIVAAIVALILTIVTTKFIEDGRYVAAGIMSLFFGSLIGAILCFACIDSRPHYVYKTSGSYSSSSSTEGASKTQSNSNSNQNSGVCLEGHRYKTKKRIFSAYGVVNEGSEVYVSKVLPDKCYASVTTESGYKTTIVIPLTDLVLDVDRTTRSNDEEIVKLLKEYKELLDQGIITQDEFDQKKKILLR